MATYNWDQVKKAISDNGLFFSDADMALAQKNPDAGMSLVNYKLDYKNATTDDQKALANAGAEKIRSDYGRYTGGKDGSKYYLNEPSPMSFEYGNTGTQSSAAQTTGFENPYAEQIQAALDKVMNQQAWENPYSDQQKAALDAVTNREAFSYDPTQDVAWRNARKQYLREADRATQDTMGQAAGLTGGMASTAAMTAASQAGDYYRGQLNDRMADYQNMAYDRYLNDANLDFNKLNAVNNMSDSDYQKYWDSIGLGFDQLSAVNNLRQQARDEFDTDRNFGYNQWTDELGFQSDKQNAALENERYKTEYGDAMTMDMYNLLMGDYEATGNADALKRARAILTALQNNMNS